MNITALTNEQQQQLDLLKIDNYINAVYVDSEYPDEVCVEVNNSLDVVYFIAKSGAVEVCDNWSD